MLLIYICHSPEHTHSIQSYVQKRQNSKGCIAIFTHSWFGFVVYESVWDLLLFKLAVTVYTLDGHLRSSVKY